MPKTTEVSASAESPTLLPDLIHAKIALSDSFAGYLGSANFSQSALEKNFELGVAGRAPDKIASLPFWLSRVARIYRGLHGSDIGRVVDCIVNR